jgi:hypothetical protein
LSEVGQEPAGGGSRRFLVGCLLMIPGFFGGGMIGAAVAKVVGQLRRCTPPEGFPACNLEPFLFTGGIAGALLLGGLVIWRLRP